jgi:hypothetical protein
MAISSGVRVSSVLGELWVMAVEDPAPMTPPGIPGPNCVALTRQLSSESAAHERLGLTRSTCT